MLPIQIKPGIFWVGTNDHITDLFEGLWPIRKEGISYNSYLIKDEKTALIDLSKEMLTDTLIQQVQGIVDLSKLDYVIINHMEPDHSGALHAIQRLAPQVEFYATAKARDMLKSFYGISERVHVIADGDELPLGEHTLRFTVTPFVHWPETMMTFEVKEGVLFSCDGFGGYGALPGTIFDDEVDNLAWYEDQSLRYYTNIVSTFSKPVRNAIKKLSETPIKVVAPSHGLIWRKDPMHIVNLYQKWADYGEQSGEMGVTLLFATMYGNTEKLMGSVAQGIKDEGVPLEIFNVNRVHPSYILPSLWTKRGVMVGAPTYEGGLFPAMVNMLEIADVKHVYNKLSARFGSHAWNGGGQQAFEKLAATLKWTVSANYEFTGAPSDEDLRQARAFGAEFARGVRGGCNNLASIKTKAE